MRSCPGGWLQPFLGFYSPGFCAIVAISSGECEKDNFKLRLMGRSSGPAKRTLNAEQSRSAEFPGIEATLYRLDRWQKPPSVSRHEHGVCLANRSDIGEQWAGERRFSSGGGVGQYCCLTGVGVNDDSVKVVGLFSEKNFR